MIIIMEMAGGYYFKIWWGGQGKSTNSAGYLPGIMFKKPLQIIVFNYLQGAMYTIYIQNLK